MGFFFIVVVVGFFCLFVCFSCYEWLFWLVKSWLYLLSFHFISVMPFWRPQWQSGSWGQSRLPWTLTRVWARASQGPTDDSGCRQGCRAPTRRPSTHQTTAHKPGNCCPACQRHSTPMDGAEQTKCREGVRSWLRTDRPGEMRWTGWTDPPGWLVGGLNKMLLGSWSVCFLVLTVHLHAPFIFTNPHLS